MCNNVRNFPKISHRKRLLYANLKNVRHSHQLCIYARGCVCYHRPHSPMSVCCCQVSSRSNCMKFKGISNSQEIREALRSLTTNTSTERYLTVRTTYWLTSSLVLFHSTTSENFFIFSTLFTKMMFKPVAFIAFASCLVATSLAQQVQISFPTNGARISAGQTLLVQLDKPRTLGGSQDIAVVIGLRPCSGNACTAVSGIGSPIVSGPFNPDNTASPPFQRFFIPIPQNLQSGQQVLISAAHFFLSGAGGNPGSEVANVTVTVN
ncbi:hypothetical protein C8Q75DRAFT_257521 [Abortiporus biennis]|nr:hypothetical protein C8Q75DRAFT_257521 [Abortiporus biennis]